MTAEPSNATLLLVDLYFRVGTIPGKFQKIEHMQQFSAKITGILKRPIFSCGVASNGDLPQSASFA